MTGLLMLAAGLVTGWAVGDPLWALVGTALYAWGLIARVAEVPPIALDHRPDSAACLEAERAAAARAAVLREVSASSLVVRQLMRDAARRVDQLAATAATLAGRDGKLALLAARAAVPDDVDVEAADDQARADLAAARAALAEGRDHAATIARARERGLAQLARIRCTLEAVLAKVLTIKALELEGDVLETAGRRQELAALSREMTALTEAVHETWQGEKL